MKIVQFDFSRLTKAVEKRQSKALDKAEAAKRDNMIKLCQGKQLDPKWVERFQGLGLSYLTQFGAEVYPIEFGPIDPTPTNTEDAYPEEPED